MAEIVPSITATSIEEYNRLLERVAHFAKRIHFDFTDGEFAPTRTPNLIQAHWPEGTQADLHLMYKRPLEHLETAISLNPHLVIIHAEAEGDKQKFIDSLKELKIKVGVALLADTEPAQNSDLIKSADHALIFGGKLGFYGGEFDSSLLAKAAALKEINEQIEIGWDGGINHQNVKQVADAGVDIINSGGYIANADDPQTAYDRLRQIANSV